MTATITRQTDTRRWLRAENKTGEEIPAYAVVLINEVELDNDGLVLYGVDKPRGPGNYAVNSGNPIAAAGSPNSFGTITFDWPAMAQIHGSASTPVAGDNWGVADNTWELAYTDAAGWGLFGFRILGLTVNRDGIRRTLITQDQPRHLWGIVEGDDILPNADGIVRLDGYGDRAVKGHLDWMHNSDKVSVGKEILLAWNDEQDHWSTIGAECELQQ